MSEEQQHQAPEVAEPQTPGQILQAARETRGYTQANIAERLCLSVQTIIDIDSDDYSHFTAEIYLRGHMRSYAKVVGADPVVVLKAFDDMGIEIEADPQVPIMLAQDIPISHRLRRTKRKVLLWASFAVLLVLIVMVVLWWQEQQSHSSYYSQKMTVPTEVHKMSGLQTATDTVKTASLKKIKKSKLAAKPVKKRARLLARRTHEKVFVPDYSITSVN